MPTLVISLVFHAGAAFLQYGQAMKGNGAPYYFACFVNAFLASIGLWCLLFATDGGHISRRVPPRLNSAQTNFFRPEQTRYRWNHYLRVYWRNNRGPAGFHSKMRRRTNANSYRPHSSVLSHEHLLDLTCYAFISNKKWTLAAGIEVVYMHWRRPGGVSGCSMCASKFILDVDFPSSNISKS